MKPTSSPFALGAEGRRIIVAGPPSAGAPTVPLQTRPITPPGAPTTKAPTVPIPTRPITPPSAGGAAGGAPTTKAPTMQLPKATVQLNPTKPLAGAGGPPTVPGASVKIGTMNVVPDDEKAENEEVASTICAILAFVASIALLAGQLMTWTGLEVQSKTWDEFLASAQRELETIQKQQEAEVRRKREQEAEARDLLRGI